MPPIRVGFSAFKRAECLDQVSFFLFPVFSPTLLIRFRPAGPFATWCRTWQETLGWTFSVRTAACRTSSSPSKGSITCSSNASGACGASAGNGTLLASRSTAGQIGSRLLVDSLTTSCPRVGCWARRTCLPGWGISFVTSFSRLRYVSWFAVDTGHMFLVCSTVSC